MVVAQEGIGTGVPLRELALVLLIGCAVTFLVTGLVRHIIIRYGTVAPPRQRDVHTVPTPRLGGVAMFSGVVIALLVANQLPALHRGFPPVTPDLMAVFIAAAIIVVVGMLDDLYDIAWWLKFGGQLLGAVLMSVLGLSWYLLYLPFGEGTTVVLDQAQSSILTAVLTVMIINAMNFVDGLDGLAAGLGFIAAMTILIFSLTILYDQGGTVSAYPPAIISAVLAGVCIGFLPHNFSPARIFMGDSGSMLIGLLLSAACVSASGRINMALFGAADVFALLAPILVVFAALSLPLLDLLMAIVRRLKQGKSPFAPDKHHLHHRLLRLGHTQRRVALVMYSWVTVVAFVTVGSTVLPWPVVVITTVLLVILAAIWTFVPLYREKHAPPVPRH